MDKRQRSALRRFRRAQEFLTANPVDGTAVNLRHLNEIIAEMTAKGEEQDAFDRKARGDTVRQFALRAALWDKHMLPISRIARRVISVPEVNVKFRLPRKVKDNQVILDTARGMAQAAEAHAAVFVQEGLPEDFVAQLRSAIDALASVLGDRVASQRRRAMSRDALEKLIKRGVGTVAILDAIVKPKVEDSPDVLAGWNRAKRPNDVGGGVPAEAEIDITPVVKVA